MLKISISSDLGTIGSTDIKRLQNAYLQCKKAGGMRPDPDLFSPLLSPYKYERM